MARARSTASPVLRFDRFGVNQLSVKAVPRRRRTAMKASWGNFEKSTPTGPPGVEPIGAKPRSLPRRSFASLASTASSIGLSLPAAGEIHAAPRPAAREREPILQRGSVRPRRGTQEQPPRSRRGHVRGRDPRGTDSPGSGRPPSRSGAHRGAHGAGGACRNEGRGHRPAQGSGAHRQAHLGSGHQGECQVDWWRDIGTR